MFENRKQRNSISFAFGVLELIYHSIVRQIRKTRGNAIAGILIEILQSVMFIITFYALFAFLGTRTVGIRGDFLLFIISGVFLFMTHIKVVAAVFGAEGASSAMMQHMPMNSIISISAAAFGSLYMQTLAVAVILFIYHVAVTPVEIDNLIGGIAMFLAAWISGVGVGVVFLSLKPWLPDLALILSTVYQRLNMIASGKMFVAAQLPSFVLPFFQWNPLFHAIDQARNAVFLNYTSDVSWPMYPIYFGMTAIAIGLMAEFFTRKHASTSWASKR